MTNNSAENSYKGTPFDLSGKTAIVTGASGGLGYRFAQTLAAAGANLVVTARDGKHPRLLDLKQSLQHVQVVASSLDVANELSVQQCVQQAVDEFGRVDILINNAGVAEAARAVDIELESWSRVTGINLDGAWLVARAFGKHLMTAETPGSIINITSILGHRVHSGVMPYAVSKAGLEQMTRSLALEWARYNIRVNSIAPGYILTEMNRDYLLSDAAAKMISNIPQKRVGDPADLDGALLLLASDASGFMTGSTITVDGGHTTSSL